jgi:hypothetical protein
VELGLNCTVLSLDVISDSLLDLDCEPNLSIESCSRCPAASEQEAQIDG